MYHHHHHHVGLIVVVKIRRHTVLYRV